MSIASALDWFVHDALRDDIVFRMRARILAGFCIFFGFVLLLNASRGFMMGDPVLGYAVGLAGLSLIGLSFFLRATGTLALSGNLFVLVYGFVLVLASYRDGGNVSQIQYNFAVMIFMGFLVCGLRTGVFWGILSALIVTLYEVMGANGYVFPPHKEESVFMNLIVIVVIALFLAFIYEVASSKNLHSFSREKAKSNADAERLNSFFSHVDDIMSGVVAGNLSQRITTEVDGELMSLKNGINSALDMLAQTLDKVRKAARKIETGTSQVSNAAQSLASGSTEQAASLEQISSSMAEIGSQAQTNSEIAQQAQVLSGDTVSAVANGNQQMEAMLASMKSINETSTNVSKVIKVIDEIAFQTNLLALNAAVEAARAGKYGKGFAVVAEEVRNLAGRSAEAAKDTTELIESSMLEVENGVRNADQTAEILKGFVESVEKVTDFVGEIAVASHEQASGAGEVNTGLNQVNEVVQQNSSISEETASASQDLASQADLLVKLMEQFQLTKGAAIPGQRRISHEVEPSPPDPRPAPVSPRPLMQPQSTDKKEVKEIPHGTKNNQIILDDDDFGKY